MQSPNAEVVRRQFEALEQGGLDAIERFWHPDIEWRAIEGALDDVGVIRGRDAMRRYYQDWGETVDDLRTAIDEVVYDSGETLIAVMSVSGHVRGSNVPVRARYTVSYTIRDGLIVRGREYQTPAEALESATGGD